MDLIALILFVVSGIGLGFLLRRAIPQLVVMPEDATVPDVAAVVTRVRQTVVPEGLSWNAVHQKFLSRCKVYLLKLERKLEENLADLRQQSAERDAKPDKAYWKELKSTKKK